MTADNDAGPPDRIKATLVSRNTVDIDVDGTDWAFIPHFHKQNVSISMSAALTWCHFTST